MTTMHVDGMLLFGLSVAAALGGVAAAAALVCGGVHRRRRAAGAEGRFAVRNRRYLLGARRVGGVRRSGRGEHVLVLRGRPRRGESAWAWLGGRRIVACLDCVLRSESPRGSSRVQELVRANDGSRWRRPGRWRSVGGSDAGFLADVIGAARPVTKPPGRCTGCDEWQMRVAEVGDARGRTFGATMGMYLACRCRNPTVWRTMMTAMICFAMCTRIGEAINPGPSAIAYASPHNPLFRGARVAEGVDCGSGCAADEPPDLEPWALKVTTANSTGWEPLKRLLLSANTSDVVVTQEHRLRGSAVAEASQWAHRRGWKSIWAEASVTEAGGLSGGVAVLVRSHLGLAPPPWGDPVIEEARAVGATVEAPGCRPTVVVSAYLVDGIGLAARNRSILARIGEHLQALGHGPDECQDRQTGPLPFIVAGDFNISPEILATSGFADGLQAAVVAPKNARGTCRTGKRHSTYDYFVLSKGLEQGLERVATREDGVIKTHVPVVASFRPRLTMLRALVVRTPPRMPTRRLFGPIPPPPDWSDVRRATQEATRAAKKDRAADAQAALDLAYEKWAGLAEWELRDATGAEVPKMGLRGSLPRLVWRSIVPEKVGRGDHSGHANDCRRRRALIRDLRIAAEDARHGCRRRARDKVDEVTEETMDQVELIAKANGTHSGDLRKWDDLCRMSIRLDELLESEATEEDGEWRSWESDRAAEEATVMEEVAAAENDERKRGRDAWREWVMEGVGSGARHAHASTRLPEAWAPTTVEDEHVEVVTADPLRLLAAQRRDYAALWGAREEGQRRWYSDDREPLERLGADDIRGAALSMREGTAQTYDGFHPRHLALLSDSALECLSDVYEAAEALGSWPSQVSLVTMPALAKPAGGYRLIGIFAGIYRVWAKARRPLADAWEERNDRGYFASGSGRSPIDAVWCQAWRAEAAIGDRGTAAAAVLTDLEKFYEHIDHDVLMDKASRHGFPKPLVRMALAAYSGPRMIRLRDFVAPEVHAGRGVIAGCSLATTLVKLYTVASYDELAARCPDVAFTNYIDDNVLCATGPPQKVKEVLIDATRIMNRIVEDDLGCRIARRKTRVVASDDGLAVAIRRGIRLEAGGEAAASAPNLGIDFAVGRCRGRHGKKSTRADRLRKGLARRNKLRRLASAIGNRALGVGTTGVVAAMVYGSEVNGLSDAEWLKVDRVAAAGLKPAARGRSLNMLMALHRAPTWRAGVGPILQFVRAVWRATSKAGKGGGADLDLPELRRAMEAVDLGNLVDNPVGRDGCERRRRRWDRVRGPAGAVLLSADRLGWSFPEPFVIVDDVGVRRVVTEHSPAMWGDLLRLAAARMYERRVAKVWARKDPSFADRRICVDHIRQLLGTNRKRPGGDPLGTGAARALVCDAIWTGAKAAEIDENVGNLCRMCGQHVDTVHHRLWVCPCAAKEREEIAPQRLIRAAKAAGSDSKFFTTGVMPHPADVWPRPLSEPQVEVERFDLGGEQPAGETHSFAGNFYFDGSCTTHVVPELRRAGFSIIIKDPSNKPLARVSTPLWEGLPQTPQAAEFAAYAGAVQYVGGPSWFFGDCLNVLRQANGSQRRSVAPHLRYSGVMKDVLKRPEQARCVQAFVKVKAHRCIDAIADADERIKAQGNAEADELAKAAVSRHPRAAPAEEAMLQTAIEDGRTIIRLAAAILKKWPPLKVRFTRGPAGDKDQGQRKGADRLRHDWRFTEGRWRCQRCLRCVNGGGGDDPGDAKGYCGGEATDSLVRAAERRGHRMAAADGECMPVWFCLKCGAWLSRRAFGLRKDCRGRPTGAGKQALRNIEQGRHPWWGPGKGGRRRPSVTVRSKIAKRVGVTRRRRTRAADEVGADAAPQPREDDPVFGDGANAGEGSGGGGEVLDRGGGEAEADHGARGSRLAVEGRRLGPDPPQGDAKRHRRGGRDCAADLAGERVRPCGPADGCEPAPAPMEGSDPGVAGRTPPDCSELDCNRIVGSVDNDGPEGRAPNAHALLPRDRCHAGDVAAPRGCWDGEAAGACQGGGGAAKRRKICRHSHGADDPGAADGAAAAAHGPGPPSAAAPVDTCASSSSARASDASGIGGGSVTLQVGDERIGRKRDMACADAAVARHVAARRRIQAVRDRVCTRGRTADGPAHCGSRGDQSAPAIGLRVDHGASVLQPAVVIRGHGIQGRGTSPGRNGLATRAQLLGHLRAIGGSGHVHSGAAPLTAVGAAQTAPPAPPPSPGGPPAEQRPAGPSRPPSSPALARPPPDRAELLRRLRGSG